MIIKATVRNVFYCKDGNVYALYHREQGYPNPFLAKSKSDLRLNQSYALRVPGSSAVERCYRQNEYPSVDKYEGLWLS